MFRKYGFIGAQNSGKTTRVKALEAVLTSLGVDLGVVDEVYRECPYAMNEDGPLEAQLWLCNRQMERELEEEGRHAVVVCDRTMVDNYAYSFRLFRRGKILPGQIAYIRGITVDWLKFHPYSTIYLCKPRGVSVPDNARNSNLTFQQEMVRIFDKVIAELKINAELIY